MFDIKRKKVKAIYCNEFYCPECGQQLHMGDKIYTTNPVQYQYYCDCGFTTLSFQVPGLEYEFEEEN